MVSNAVIINVIGRKSLPNILPILDAKLVIALNVVENDFIAHDTLKNHDITIIYIPFVNINNFLFEKFLSFHITLK